MQRDSFSRIGPKPWGSPYAMKQGPGYQVNWERVSDFFRMGKWNVQLNGAAAIGADALTVDALSRGIRRGERIDFGDAETVTFTVGAALVNATTVPVTTVGGLPGPIPNGAVLRTGDSQEFLKLTTAAAAGDAALTVEAIPNAIEGGETVTFQGGAQIVEVIEDVDAGATSIPISNLGFALADNAKGYLQKDGFANGDKFIPEATAMALDKTTTPWTMIPRYDSDVDAGETCFGFIASDASNSNAHSSDAKSGYGTVVGNTYLYENLLPDADENGDFPTLWKTELSTNGHFRPMDFMDYVDSRAS